jgi:SAM-dependent methyltransferase
VEFSFESWPDRHDDADLRAAWLASRSFVANWDLGPFRAHCPLCGSSGEFRLMRLPDDGAEPDVREHLTCTRCACNTRLRGALGLLRGHTAAIARPRIYVTEQVTATFVWMQRSLPGEVIGSEYEPSWRRRRQLTAVLKQMGGHGRVRFQDVTRLGFRRARLDAVASFEVLEHVPAFETAIDEFARILKPGGVCVATFPFTDGAETIVRARITADGQIEHLLEPEYHGDPLGAGILCFRHFGWDIVQTFKAHGFSEAAMVMPYDLDQALPYGMWTLVARR